MKRPLVVGYKGEIGSFILNGLLRIMPKALDIRKGDLKLYRSIQSNKYLNKHLEETEKQLMDFDIDNYF